MSKWVYSFGAGRNEGRAAMRDLLGNKGANLAEMSGIGLPVPAGFTLTTELCVAFNSAARYPDGLEREVDEALAHVEGATGLSFGDADRPLLVAVRSGARVSMPGMMDTVLNLGLNDRTVVGLAAGSGDPRFAWDSYRRFVQMYGSVVLGVEHHRFEEIIEQLKFDSGLLDDTELEAEHWQQVVAEYMDLVTAETGSPFPQDTRAQLWGAIAAVLASWMNPRAETYRRLYDIPAEWGTAVSVQAMVFGNMGEGSGTGVCFTRDPSTGENVFYGEYLVNAQGEDVVAGIRTPQPMTRRGARPDETPMETALPEAYAALERIRDVLERHYRDMQDLEFTVQRGALFMLQTRSGKRTAAAALRIAVDMAGEGLIDRHEAVARVDAASLDQLLHPVLDPSAERRLFSKGLPASPGAVSGAIVFTADEAERQAAKGVPVVMVRAETSPEDIHGMHAAAGVLTTRGGMTSHAAVVARGMGRACVAGAGGIEIDAAARTMSSGGVTLREGDAITLDGSTGEVFIGRVATVEPALAGDFSILLAWADDIRRMRVRASAETPAEAQAARRFGAEGIGICRTEHMFSDPARVGAMREVIMSANEAGRRSALARLLPLQRGDVADILRVMGGLPVAIRLLDAPLRQFLPQGAAEIAAVAAELGLDPAAVERRSEELAETNPMLGHRGCRLGITFPEIYEMQVRAILEGAVAVANETGRAVAPEIMIPLLAGERELEITRALVDRIAAAVLGGDDRIRYRVGAMIELPRAALLAGRIAVRADFFSFGTNDLTQAVFGFSRDDAGRFLPHQVDAGIVAADPFVSIDQEGVGELMRIAVERGRSAKARLEVGMCGQHGGDPASIRFCEALGLDYVSCSPFRVPVARLAAAQAMIGVGRALSQRR